MTGWINALFFVTAIAVASLPASESLGAAAGLHSAHPLTVVEEGKSAAVIVSSPQAGRLESQAASDLQKYIALMTGVTLPLVNSSESIERALVDSRPMFVIGQTALEKNASFRAKLAAVIKHDPHIRADGVGCERETKSFSRAPTARVTILLWRSFFAPGASAGSCPVSLANAFHKSRSWLLTT